LLAHLRSFFLSSMASASFPFAPCFLGDMILIDGPCIVTERNKQMCGNENFQRTRSEEDSAGQTDTQ
jgi:hypothetical protein